MKCKSASSTVGDGYRAGCELGDSLVDIAPEVVLLFTSVSYHGEFPDLLAGLQDALASPSVIVFGGTSDGVYETSRVTHCGACALGLSSGGAVQWTVSVASGVEADPFGAARRCAEEGLSRAGGACDFAFALADGLKADGSKIVEGLSSVLATPFFGGLTGDDRKFAHSFVLADGMAREDVVALLLGRGPVHHALHAASGWIAIGRPGRVDRVDGMVVHEINGQPAQSFMREQLGKAPSETDLGLASLAVYSEAHGDHFCLRSPSRFDPLDESVKVFGSIAPGATVQVCTATREDIVLAVEQSLVTVRGGSPAPVGAIIISCAARKWLLGDRCREEVDRVFQALGERIPVVGLPSFGEISPLRCADGSYTPPLFHNVTYVICLIGA